MPLLSRDDLVEVEGDALELHARAGLDPEERPGAWLLARALLGRAPELVPGMREAAALVSVGGSPRIYVRAGTPPPRARWLVGHELGHWLYGAAGGPALEARCDALGAAIDVPRAALLRARREVGDGVRRLARVLDTTQSLALLRLGEVAGTPVALVAQRWIRVRGEVWGWPDEPTLRGIVKVRHLPPQLARVRITDEGERVGLVARAEDD